MKWYEIPTIGSYIQAIRRLSRLDSAKARREWKAKEDLRHDIYRKEPKEIEQ